MRKRFHANKGFGEDEKEFRISRYVTITVDLAPPVREMDFSIDYATEEPPPFKMTPEEMLAVHREVCGLKDGDLKPTGFVDPEDYDEVNRQIRKIHERVARRY